jgi:predicted anti-sigma-YlaC factor YlaD
LFLDRQDWGCPCQNDTTSIPGQQVSITDQFVRSGTGTYPLNEITSATVALKIVRLERNLRWWASWTSLVGAVVLAPVSLFFPLASGTVVRDVVQFLMPLLGITSVVLLPIKDFQHTVKLKGTFGDADLNVATTYTHARYLISMIKKAKKSRDHALTANTQPQP